MESNKRPRYYDASDGEDDVADVGRDDAPSAENAGMEQLLNSAEDVDEVDAASVRAMASSLKKALKSNQKMRMKHADDPAQFVDSEVELDECLTRMHAIASAPEHYHVLVDAGGVPALVECLRHDNTDIIIEAIDLVKELTDPDLVEDASEALALVEAFTGSQGLEVLVDNMRRLDESQPEDEAAIHDSLAIMENLMEARPSVAAEIAKRTTLLGWLLSRVKRAKEFNQNTLYASEILSILLMQGGVTAEALAKLDGMDALLVGAAAFRKLDPQSAEQGELCANVFNCLCSALNADSANKQVFCDAEGVELMLFVLRERAAFARKYVVRVLSFAMDRSAASCQKSVEAGGLKFLFPVFMATGSHKHYSKAEVKAEAEHAISLVASLMTLIPATDRSHQRLLAKFSEQSFEKTDRLMELFETYTLRLRAFETDAEDPDEIYLNRIDAGLFVLQQLCMLMVPLLACAPIRGHIFELLNQNAHNLLLSDAKAVLAEYAENVGDALPASEREAERAKVQSLAQQMAALLPAEPAAADADATEMTE